MPPLPENRFLWTWERHETFHACLRRYYYEYYAAWGGWLPSAPPRTRALYTAKRLLTRRQWAAARLRRAIAAAIADPASPDLPSLPRRTLDAMRAEFAASRAAAYRQDPARIPGLVEHECALPVDRDEWAAVARRVSGAIEAFLASPLFAAIRTLPPGDILANTPARLDFAIDGLPVRTTPALHLRAPGLRIYDWIPLDASLPPDQIHRHRTRLALEALAAISADPALADPPPVIVLHDPLSANALDLPLSPEDLENARQFALDSAEEMLYPLDGDPARIDPPEDAFDCNAPPAACPACPFLRLCPRWRS